MNEKGAVAGKEVGLREASFFKTGGLEVVSVLVGRSQERTVDCVRSLRRQESLGCRTQEEASALHRAGVPQLQQGERLRFPDAERLWGF